MTDSPHSILDHAGLDRAKATALVAEALKGADDGELYLEHSQSEGAGLRRRPAQDRRASTPSQGFGLRAVSGEAAGYAHSGEISRAGDPPRRRRRPGVKAGHAGTYAAAAAAAPTLALRRRKSARAAEFRREGEAPREIDALPRGKDPRVRQVSASLAGSLQHVEILRADGTLVATPARWSGSTSRSSSAKAAARRSGSHGMGGREGFRALRHRRSGKHAVDEALRQAIVNLSAVPAPAGTMDVVLGPGWPGILLHEAIGHGLEGDFNRKKTAPSPA